MPRTGKYYRVLTRRTIADYLGVDPNSLSSGRSVKVLKMIGEPLVTIGDRFELRDARTVVDNVAKQASENRLSKLNPEALERAPQIKAGTTIVSNVELGRVFGVDSAAIANRRTSGLMPVPVAEFEGVRTPPAYDLDDVLEMNAARREPWAVDEAVVAELRETNTLPEA
jgi:hypothetical protein